MIVLVKWTLGIVAIIMTYMVMLTAVANASEALNAGIIERLVM